MVMFMAHEGSCEPSLVPFIQFLMVNQSYVTFSCAFSWSPKGFMTYGRAHWTYLQPLFNFNSKMRSMIAFHSHSIWWLPCSWTLIPFVSFSTLGQKLYTLPIFQQNTIKHTSNQQNSLITHKIPMFKASQKSNFHDLSASLGDILVCKVERKS